MHDNRGGFGNKRDHAMLNSRLKLSSLWHFKFDREIPLSKLFVSASDGQLSGATFCYAREGPLAGVS